MCAGSNSARQLNINVMRPVPTSGRLEGIEGLTAIWARNRRSKEDVRDASTECEAIRAILRDPRRREPFVRGDVHVGAPSFQYLRR